MKTEDLIRQIRGILNDGFKAPEMQRQLVLELLDEAEHDTRQAKGRQMKTTTLRSDTWLDAIRAGKRKFRARRARRDIEDGSAPEWGADEVVTLSVFLADARHAKHHHVGKILTLALVEDLAWAEYSEGDYCGEGQFIAEEYRLQLREVLD